MRADKAVRPAGALNIGSARRVIGKLPLELREGLGKPQIVALVDIHRGHDEQILVLVDASVNRIGRIGSMTGGVLFFVFVAMVVYPAVFGAILGATGSYAYGFFLGAVPALIAGLSFLRQDKTGGIPVRPAL